MSALDRLKLRFLVLLCVVLALGTVSSWGWAWSQRSLTLEGQALARACTYLGPAVEAANARADALEARWDELLRPQRPLGTEALEIEP